MSIPVPAFIVAADICRDGGSYVLVFADKDQHRYEIEVPVIVGGAGRTGYAAPTMKSYESGSIQRLSWEEAKHLSKLLTEAMKGPVEWGGRVRAVECIEILQMEGNLP